jgi:hypothetical protein
MYHLIYPPLILHHLVMYLYIVGILSTLQSLARAYLYCLILIAGLVFCFMWVFFSASLLCLAWLAILLLYVHLDRISCISVLRYSIVLSLVSRNKPKAPKRPIKECLPA